MSFAEKFPTQISHHVQVGIVNSHVDQEKVAWFQSDLLHTLLHYVHKIKLTILLGEGIVYSKNKYLQYYIILIY